MKYPFLLANSRRDVGWIAVFNTTNCGQNLCVVTNRLSNIIRFLLTDFNDCHGFIFLLEGSESSQLALRGKCV